MQLPIFKRKAVERLWNLACNSPKDYASRQFEADGEIIKDDELQRIPKTAFDPNLFDQLVLPAGDRSVGASDAENAMILFQELKGMTPKIARDERVWAALSHLNGKDFVWRRHVRGIPDEGVSRKIQTNFFCRANGKERGFTRDNALSQLWWWAFICSRVESLSHAEALETLLAQTDVRDSIIGRPTMGRIPQVVEALLLVIRKEQEFDPDLVFFSRRKREQGSGYLELSRIILRHGGRVFFDTMSVSELVELFWSIRKSIS